MDDEEEVEEQYLPTGRPSTLEFNHLTAVQQSQMRDICSADVFSENPGHTTLVEHDIVLNDNAQAQAYITARGASRGEKGKPT